MSRSIENMSVRVPPHLRDRIDDIAARLDRSRNWIVNAAIEHYLDVYTWQEDRARERSTQAEATQASFTAHDEAMREVEATLDAK